MTVMKHENGGRLPKRLPLPDGSQYDKSGLLAKLLSFRWVLIAFVLILWFVYYPIIDNFIVSTTNQDIFTGETAFVGLDNYRRLQDMIRSSGRQSSTIRFMRSFRWCFRCWVHSYSRRSLRVCSMRHGADSGALFISYHQQFRSL